MEWMNEPNEIETYDNCVLKACWSHQGQGICGWNFCGEKFCGFNYSS